MASEPAALAEALDAVRTPISMQTPDVAKLQATCSVFRTIVYV